MKKVYEDTIKVYDKLGKKYLDDSSKVSPPERAGFIKLLPKGAKILDVGCGGGRDSKEFVKKGFTVTGIDLSGVLIKIAKKEIPNAKFFKMDMLDLLFPSKSFDAVWAQAALLHLTRNDAVKTVKNFYKLLRVGGFLHVRVKKGQGTDFVKEKISGWHERFYTYFSKKEMELLFKKSGFQIVRSQIMPDELKRPDVKWISIWGKK